MGSNTVLMMGLSNLRLYGTNNNTENIRQNASYDNNEKKVKAEILAENKD